MRVTTVGWPDASIVLWRMFNMGEHYVTFCTYGAWRVVDTESCENDKEVERASLDDQDAIGRGPSFRPPAECSLVRQRPHDERDRVKREDNEANHEETFKPTQGGHIRCHDSGWTSTAARTPHPRECVFEFARERDHTRWRCEFVDDGKFGINA